MNYYDENGKDKLKAFGVFDPEVTQLKLNHNIVFVNGGQTVGTLDFNGPSLVFTGDAETSAKVFIDCVAQAFATRLEEERQAALESVAKMLHLKAEDYAKDFGFDDMGALEFSRESQREYHSTLVELEEEVRTMTKNGGQQ